MQVVNSSLITGKKVLLRLDIDVPIENGKVVEDFRLRAGLPTLKLCLQNADKVIIIGHLGWPFAYAEDEKKGWPKNLSAKPVAEWYKKELGEEVEFAKSLEQAEKSTSGLVMLENIRFFHGEIPGAEYHKICTSKTCDIDFARKLSSLGEYFVNEAFASYNPGVSTTILPTLLPHAYGLRFAEEVDRLRQVRENPKKPFVAVMGGAKVADKLPVIEVLAKTADAVLVGGKLISEIREQKLNLPKNVMVGMLNKDGFDIAPETTQAWGNLIRQSRMIVWNGPVGRIEENTWKVSKDFTFQVEKLGSAKSTYEIAKMVLNSHAQIVVGGGDTVAFLRSLGLLGEFEKKAFVSVGGGAMLKFLSDGTLPTIEALK